MKKILITFFVILLSISTTYASNCIIKDTPIDSLNEYIENNRIIINNLNKQLIDKDKTKEKSIIQEWTDEYDKVKTSWLKIYNSIFYFDSYYSYFKYFASFPISNEIPYEVKRDYRLLENEWKWIKSYLDNIVYNWLTDTIIKDICNWVKWNCDFESEIKAWELIAKLTANNEAIMDLLRNTIIWETYKNPTQITLVNNNFQADIQTYYSIEYYSKCSEEEWWFFDTIMKSIKEIWTLNKQAKDWIQKWKDAVDLMLWNDTTNETYAETEKWLLKDELSKQWISWDNQSNMMDSLDKYNSEWLSKDNNFIRNTFNNTRLKLENKLKEFKNEVIGDFFQKKQEWNIETTSIIKAQENSTNTNEIKENIDKMYLELSNFSAISENNITNLRSELLEMHIDLSNSINILDISCWKAVTICNQQDYGRWNCWKCN